MSNPDDELPHAAPGACRAPGRRRPAAKATCKPRSRAHRRSDACPQATPPSWREEAEDAGPIISTTGALEGFANWFADWWLRRGRQLTSTNSQGGDDA